MSVPLVWEAISGGVMLAGGLLLAWGLFTQRPWVRQFDTGGLAYRVAGIVMGVVFSIFGAYFVSQAYLGHVLEKWHGGMP